MMDELFKRSIAGLSLEDAKAMLVGSIKRRAGTVILTRYPSFKQFNIADPMNPDYDEQAHREMSLFIKGIRDTSDAAEESAKALTSLAEVEAFSMEMIR
jgi:hypothetical protein